MENFNTDKLRASLFGHLDNVLKVADEKFHKNKKKDEQRLKWGRLIVQAVNAYGKVLETVELDSLNERVGSIGKEG